MTIFPISPIVNSKKLTEEEITVTQTALENTELAVQAPNGPNSIAHLQQVSRIAASTWQRWCELLRLSPSKATEVWEGI